MAVHAGAGIQSGTVANALVHRFQTLSTVGGEIRPGIVHRLDRLHQRRARRRADRPGHLYSNSARQFAAREVEKIYLALVEGRMEGKGRIQKSHNPRPEKPHPNDRAPRIWPHLSLPIGKPIEHFPGFTLLRIRLGTGRTHQIRAHMAALHHPVAGDTAYGAKAQPWARYFLHAHRLGFRSPATGQPVIAISPLSPDLEKWRSKTRGRMKSR